MSNAYGVEINPIARLISQTKITPIEPDVLEETLTEIISYARQIKHADVAVPESLNYWFTPNVISQLLILREVLHNKVFSLGSEKISIKNFFWMCFSSLIRRKSLANPRVAPPVKINPEKFKKKSKAI